MLPGKGNGVRKKKKEGWIHRLLTGLFWLAVLVSVTGIWKQTAVSASAAEKQTGNLRILYACDNGKTAVSGAEFSAVMVARGTRGRDAWSFTLEKEFAGKDSIPDPGAALFWSDSGLARRLLDLWQKQTGRVTGSGVTDSNGTLCFTDFPAGIYLVWQSGSSGKSLEYETAEPFLVSLPSREKWMDSVQTQDNRQENTEGTDSRAYPKTAKKTGDVGTTDSPVLAKILKEPEPDRILTESSPRGQGTGDTSWVCLFLLISVLSLTGLIFWAVRKRQREKSES